ncbi:hypothetical protein WN944_000245 [Citrus x changshan-huyou]|uniref:SNRNP25 ubiquitin-like domain-containing protein n=1 Tax=Citrus x changshan-huyou TaxID=2935761 RepID=A0AAP0QQ44_9ROSI
MLRIAMEEFSPRISVDSPRHSGALSLMIGGFSRKNFLYNKLPEQPLKLSVRKLDGSCFDIEVMKTATIAELRQAVEAAFSHMPKTGPGKISWPHVWGHFCLCYNGQKLICENDNIKYYGIRDGDQLEFIRHQSINYMITEKETKKQEAAKEHHMFSSQSNIWNEQYQELSSEEDCDCDDVESGRCQGYVDKYERIDDQNDSNFVPFLRGWFSYSRLVSVRRTKSKVRRISVTPKGKYNSSEYLLHYKLCQRKVLDYRSELVSSPGSRRLQWGDQLIFQCFIPAMPTAFSANANAKLVKFQSAMASMIVASSNAKPLSPLPIPSQSPKPRIQIPQIKIPQKLLKLSSSALKSLSAVAVTSLAFSPPSLAAEIEKAALFDFNLTLPIIMVEFLVLMFALDKIYYSPLGNFMDERDNAIKEKLNSVKDTSEEVKQLEEQAAAVMRAARAEISAALTKMKKETQLEVEQKLAVGRKKIEAELQEALANLEKQKEDTIKSLDSQIAALSEEIVRKVLPVQ